MSTSKQEISYAKIIGFYISLLILIGFDSYFYYNRESLIWHDIAKFAHYFLICLGLIGAGITIHWLTPDSSNPRKTLWLSLIGVSLIVALLAL